MKKNDASSLDAKKSTVLNGRQHKLSFYLGILTIFGLITAIGAVFFKFDQWPLPANPPSTAASDKTQVTHPLSLFETGHAHHFEFKTGELTVRYFILKSSDGVIRAAFDACDVCWPSGKGYFQDGDSMVCRNCGRRFASLMVNEIQGGCNPAPLNRTIKGNQVILKVDDLIQGKPYFDYNGKNKKI